MKARIVTKIPERVLLFAIDKTVQEKLNGILQKLDIQSHTVDVYKRQVIWNTGTVNSAISIILIKI